MYTEDQLVRIAKRENNNKRNYLVVDPLQGKHVPAKPNMTLDLFQALGKMVQKAYPHERLLCIGFAETATAIGTAVAIETKSYYMQTTRETIAGVEYLYFSEAHSHATEQKLIQDDLQSILCEIDRIIFVEDEVTTGNTILNIVRLIRQKFPRQVQFAAASLLNGMNENAKKSYEQEHIPVHYLVKSNHDEYELLADDIKNDGIYHKNKACSGDKFWKDLRFEGYLNARRLIHGNNCKTACEKLWQQVSESVDVSKSQRILVLGTEEFMYPSLYTASKLEELGKNVRFHATTRSPIVVSQQAEYPLHTRYELASVYDPNRTTFVYNLLPYDLALVITEESEQGTLGIHCLANALCKAGTENITVIRWCSR